MPKYRFNPKTKAIEMTSPPPPAQPFHSTDLVVKRQFLEHVPHDIQSKRFYYDHTRDILWRKSVNPFYVNPSDPAQVNSTAEYQIEHGTQLAVAVYVCRFHDIKPANLLGLSQTPAYPAPINPRVAAQEHATLCPLTKRIIIVRRSYATRRAGREPYAYVYKAELHELFQLATTTTTNPNHNRKPINVQVAENVTPDHQRIMNL